MASAPLAPDTKDWTWVLERPCGECGFDPAAYPLSRFVTALGELAGEWTSVLGRDDLRTRRRRDRWSDLEYACHVRDVFRVMDRRLASMLVEDDPLFQNWDQDATAREEHYDEQDPATVTRELRDAADRFSDRVDAVRAEEWSRPGTRSNGSRFSVETLVRYALHDVVHHLFDVAADS